MDILEKFVHREFIERELQFSEVYRYLDRYSGIEKRIMQRTRRNENVKVDHTIWLFWKQGMEDAPQLVRKCYGSVCRNRLQDFDVVLLTEDTLDRYITLPSYIWDKYKKGYITTTHLSDIIRLELLCTYGGCWVDATVFCSDIIPEYMLTGEMFAFKLPSVLGETVLKLSSWWLASRQSNRLIHLTRQMLYEYWKQEVDMRNYFLLHIAMSKLIDEDSECRNIFLRIPYFNSGNAHVLQGKLGEQYDEEEWNIIKSISHIHKLTHKKRYIQVQLRNVNR